MSMMFRRAATPGPWYGGYHGDWKAAHGNGLPGSFCAGDVWSSSTLDWDREWFDSHLMRMPKRTQRRAPEPGGITLGPGESVTLHLTEEDPT